MADPEDEPLAEWAARREKRRAGQREITGTRRAPPLTEGARASHVAPDAPRLLLEWDGTAWVTRGVAPNADAAREFLGHAPAPECGPDVQPAPPRSASDRDGDDIARRDHAPQRSAPVRSCSL